MFFQFSLANVKLDLKLNINQVLTYQQANYYYIPSFQVKKDFNSQERIIFSIKNLKIDHINKIYTNEYTIDTFISQNFKQDTLNLINNFLLKGFKVIFVMKSNYELIYSPEIIYFYEKLPDYEKNKSLVQDLKSNQYFLNIAKNSIEWMKPLNSGEILSEYQEGYVKFNLIINYSFNDYKTLNLNKRLANINTVLYKGEGRVLEVGSNMNLFKNLELVDSKVNCFEYYEKDTNIPILLQREIKMKFNSSDPSLQSELYKKTGNKYFEFHLLRTLMLVSR
ncbi:MAG: hypothetical protein ACP5RD_02860 [bacterium]